MMLWDQTPYELFVRGGGVMWPLLACSVLALAVSLERVLVFLWFSGSFARLAGEIGGLVRQGKRQAAIEAAGRYRTPVARVVEQYLRHVDADAEAREEICGREASQQITRLERRMSWLALIGQMAPMLGLLGTVTGLITVFHDIEKAGGTVHPLMLAKGIWEALLTTVFGLVIALPTLAVYGLLDQRVGATSLQMQWIVAYLNEWLHKNPAPKIVAPAGTMPGLPTRPPVVPEPVVHTARTEHAEAGAAN